MGSALSKVQGYFRAKVDNTKLAIRNKIDDTKQAIRNSLDNAKNSVVTRVCNVKTGICTKVNDTVTGVTTAMRSTRDDVYNSVYNTKTRICNRVSAVKNSVCTTVSNVKNGIVSRVNNAVAAIVNAKNAVVTKIVNTKNTVKQRYMDTKDRIHAKYRSVREAKLTRWQKFRYSMLASVVLIILAITTLTLLDLYLGDYDRAEERLQTVWYVVSTTAENIWYVFTVGLTYLFYGIRYGADGIWSGTKVGARYTLVGCQVGGHYMWEGSKVASEYAVAASKVTGRYALAGTQSLAHYAWLGTRYGAEYGYHGAKVALVCLSDGAQIAFEYAAAATVTGCHYLAEGSKVGAEYAAKGSVYAYEHGSVAAKDGFFRFCSYTVYFVTNFRMASAEAVVWTWETLQFVLAAVASGSYTGGRYFLLTSADLLAKTYAHTVNFVLWSYYASLAAFDWTVDTALTVAYWTKTSSIEGFNVTSHFVSAIYHGIIDTSVYVYDTGVACVDFVKYWSVTSASFLWTWSECIVTTVFHYIYVGMSDYGFRWLAIVGSWLVDLACILGRIFSKFFTDLTIYVCNFVYVTASHIYAVVYVLCAFVYHIVAAVAGIVRVVLGGAVYCTTAMFRTIIWFLHETIFAYMYMLHKYNMYREILFLAFIGLLSVYCTGLMRDRRRLDETDIAEESSDEEEDINNVEGKEGKHLAAIKTRKDHGDLLSSGDEQIIPGHEECDSSDDDLPDFGIPAHNDEGGDRLEREEDFLPEQEVLDFMDNFDAKPQPDASIPDAVIKAD